jgi:hypothetical protein
MAEATPQKAPPKANKVKKACPLCKTNEHAIVAQAYTGQPAVLPQEIPDLQSKSILIQASIELDAVVLFSEQLICGGCGIQYLDILQQEKTKVQGQAMTQQQLAVMRQQQAAAMAAGQQAAGGMGGQ